MTAPLIRLWIPRRRLAPANSTVQRAARPAYAH
jgi:hypothetical protein